MNSLQKRFIWCEYIWKAFIVSSTLFILSLVVSFSNSQPQTCLMCRAFSYSVLNYYRNESDTNLNEYLLELCKHLGELADHECLGLMRIYAVSCDFIIAQLSEMPFANIQFHVRIWWIDSTLTSNYYFLDKRFKFKAIVSTFVWRHGSLYLFYMHEGNYSLLFSSIKFYTKCTYTHTRFNVNPCNVLIVLSNRTK